MTYIALTPFDLALAATLILINAAVSWGFNLGLGSTLLLNTSRMVVQLTLIGLVLKWIFAQSSLIWTASLAAIMIAAAGYEIVSRQTRRLKSLMAYGLGSTAMLFSSIVATLFAVVGVIGPDPWYEPRYLLPILGMVLGNAMTGVSLMLSTITDLAVRDRNAIEARLALGATRWTAMSHALRNALRTGLMPIINAMAASGIVSLPGMMTGQILSGMDPVDAAKYQIMIMFVIGGATALAVLLAGFGSLLLLTDERHRLRLDRLHAPNG